MEIECYWQAMICILPVEKYLALLDPTNLRLHKVIHTNALPFFFAFQQSSHVVNKAFWQIVLSSMALTPVFEEVVRQGCCSSKQTFSYETKVRRDETCLHYPLPL